MVRRAIISLTLACVFYAASAWATPRIPASNNEVLELLPTRPLLRPQNATPADPRTALQQALENAHALIMQSRAEGDPRYLGYAEAELNPWLRQPDPVVPVRLLRARLRQSTHRFQEALDDLTVVLKKSPGNAEALLIEASIYQVQGRYAEAHAACQGLGSVALEMAMTCMSQQDSLSGQARPAFARLQTLAGIEEREMTPDQLAWLRLALGDIATRLNENELAGHYYLSALDGGGPDALASYADWLLDSGRPADVMPLLQNWTRNDGLLLRLTEAEAALHRSQATGHIAQLGERFAALRLRGEMSHQREEALFQLKLMHNAGMALQLARSNWAQQREPADVRLYLMAARAANSNDDVQIVRQWLRQTHLEDRRLTPLLALRQGREIYA
jgi:hypothetical protein